LLSGDARVQYLQEDHLSKDKNYKWLERRNTMQLQNRRSILNNRWNTEELQTECEESLGYGKEQEEKDFNLRRYIKCTAYGRTVDAIIIKKKTLLSRMRWQMETKMVRHRKQSQQEEINSK